MKSTNLKTKYFKITASNSELKKRKVNKRTLVIALMSEMTGRVQLKKKRKRKTDRGAVKSEFSGLRLLLGKAC